MSKGKDRGIHGGVKGLIRPWYCSRLFWLGVPGLVFLVWGWQAHPDRYNSAFMRLGDRTVLSVVDHPKAVQVSYIDYDRGKFAFPEVDFDSGKIDPTERKDGLVTPFPPAILYEVETLKVESIDYALGARHVPSLALAYWFLIVLYLAVWVGSLLWWQHRKSRRDSSQ